MEKFDTLILEISGEKGDLGEYQKVLCEASAKGIDRVLFGCICDKRQDKSKEIFYKLMESCKILEVTPISSTLEYNDEVFGKAMVCKTDENYTIVSSLLEVVGLDHFKNSVGNGANFNKEVNKRMTKIK